MSKNNKKLTGYPSIDKLHEKDASFFEKYPIIPNLSVYNLLKLTSSKYREAIAVDCLDACLTYEELIKKIDIVSRALKNLGIKKHDIICAQMENLWQAVVCFYAANKIGAIITFLYSQAEIDEVIRYIEKFKAPILINCDRNRTYNSKVLDNTNVKHIITIQKKNLSNTNLEMGSINQSNTYIDFNQIGLIAKKCKRKIMSLQSGKNTALILFTSGTTGNPKSVMLSNSNIVATAIYLKNNTKLGLRVGERVLVCVPFSYPYGFVTSTIMSHLCGRTTVLCPGINDKNISDCYLKKPNLIMGTPTFYQMTMNYVDMDLSSIHFGISGGDFLYESKAQEIIKFFHDHGSDLKLSNGSGNAETTGGNTNAFGKDYLPTSVGNPLIGTTAIIINPETYEELKYGEEGMLCISGKNVFKGYYKETKLTEEIILNYKGKKFLKTGTNGILHENGEFELTGRSSRFYITSTMNKVYLDHVQVLINAMEGVKESAIVKKPHEKDLFVNKAYIVLKDDYYPSDEMKRFILEQCKREVTLLNGEKAQLKPYEIPNSVEFITKIPRTVGSGKINYQPLELKAANE